MAVLRLFLRDHRRLAALVFALALAMKALMPSGLMLGAAPGTKVLTVLVCADAQQGGSYEKQIVIPHSGKSQGGKSQGEPSKTSDSCPWSALGMAALPGADAALLALALAFILALGFAAAPPLRLTRASYLRPPLRGPPAAA